MTIGHFTSENIRSLFQLQFSADSRTKEEEGKSDREEIVKAKICDRMKSFWCHGAAVSMLALQIQCCSGSAFDLLSVLNNLK